MSDADWVSFDEARRRIRAAVRPTGTERVPLREALGRAASADVSSRVAHPAWDNSAMDGFAVRAEDVHGATAETPVTLPISDDIPAGRFPNGPLAAGTAARVMTGAAVPEGATGVVRVEHTDGGTGDRVTIRDDADADRHIRLRGEDVGAGDVVIEAGDEIGPAEIALLAMTGTADVEVGRRPRIGVLANGDELAGLEDIEEVLAGRKIMNSNSYGLAAQLVACGAEPVLLGIALDDPRDVARRIALADDCHGIVSAAGVSVGDHDHVKSVLDGMGFERAFWRVRMRPGSAMLFGLLEGRPFWGVPGNPVSALVSFETLVRPALRTMTGFRRPERTRIPCRLGEEVSGPEDVLAFLRVRIVGRAGDTPIVTLTGAQGSGMLRSMRADGLLELAEGVGRIDAGAVADILPIRDWYDAP